MEIIKYKKLKNGKYELLLSNDRKLELYEDVILKYDLLIKKQIDVNNKEIFDFNTECDVYNAGLKALKTRTRSKMEIKEKLKKDNFSQEMIDRATEKLESQGYINDRFFATSFLNNKLLTSSSGPYKIRKELEKKGIKNEIINDVLLDYTKEIQEEKISKIINKAIKSNRNKSNVMLRRKIQNDLIFQGFDKTLIDVLISKTEFPNDNNIAKKEYEKLYNKLSKKYSGAELKLKIKQKLYQKGIYYEE